MAKVGDRVKVNINDVVLSGTAIKGNPLSVWGRIIEDLEHSWLVELELSVEGKNRLVVPKDAEIATRGQAN